jgi:hypothetical protein
MIWHFLWNVDHESMRRAHRVATKSLASRPHLALPEKAKAWALDEHGVHKEQILLELNASGHAVLVIGPQHKTLWYEVEAK